MPEHVHLLTSEPEHGTLASAVQAIKQSVSRKLIGEREHFWQARYYDVNGRSPEEHIEKLKYIHRNHRGPQRAPLSRSLGWKPVKRGLVERPEAWPWSSFGHYIAGEEGRVEIESHSTKYARRERERRKAPP